MCSYCVFHQLTWDRKFCSLLPIMLTFNVGCCDTSDKKFSLGSKEKDPEAYDMKFTLSLS